MVLLVCGINYKQAKLSIREQCAVSDHSLTQMLSQLNCDPKIQEAMILSTCNRTELIVVADPAWAALDWMAHYFNIDAHDFPGYIFQERSAIQHLMEVACGLDSMVLGETQILGQIKKAYEQAREQKTIGPELQQLFPYIFYVGKTVRKETDICSHAGTIPAVIRQLAQESKQLSGTPKILYIGASEMNTDIAKALHAYGFMPTYWINRTFEKADKLSDEIGGTALKWEELANTIPNIDMIITATSSAEPILNLSHFTENDRHLCIDLAIPRDIHEDIRGNTKIDLYYLDDLQSRLQDGQAFRQNAAVEAQKLIQKYLDEFNLSKIQQEHSTLISQYRAQAECTRLQALGQAICQLQNGSPAEEVCAQLSKQLTARLLHHPTLGLRDMIARSDNQTLACLAARLEKQHEKLSD
jgi:glutamyl-tRNA reductase